MQTKTAAENGDDCVSDGALIEEKNRVQPGLSLAIAPEASSDCDVLDISLEFLPSSYGRADELGPLFCDQDEWIAAMSNALEPLSFNFSQRNVEAIKMLNELARRHTIMGLRALR